MSRYVASGAYVFLLLSSSPLFLSRPASAAPVLSVRPTSLSVQTAVGTNALPQTVRVTNLPPTGVGPQATITCPAGAVDIWPGQSIQRAVNSYPGSTTFCLRAGVHSLTSSTRPKTGNTFVGEYGAILDGTGWTTADDTQAA